MTGAVQTLWLSALTIVLGTVVGLLCGLAASAAPRPVRWVIAGYVFFVRGIPVLVLMFITYYALPALGYRMSNYVAVAIAMVVYAGAFFTEVVRGGLAALPRGQTEAAKSLGMRRLKIIYDILLPQAVRPALAPWLNNSIVMVKSTAYASIVGAWELTYAAREVVERTLAAFEIFFGVMLIYFLICWPMSALSRRLESRTAVIH